MNRFAALLIIIAVHLMPLVVNGQKRTAPQTKTGRLTINVAFEAEQIAEIKRKDGDYSEIGNFRSKITARYQYSESLKAVSHNGFVSLTDPAGRTTTGKFTYEQSGRLINKAPSGGDSQTDEIASYSGTISSSGTGSVQMADQGDSIVAAGISAFADLSGYSTKTVTDRDGKKVDKTCSTGMYVVQGFDVEAVQPDGSRPPESACTGKAKHSADITVKIPADLTDLTASENWAPLTANGSFTTGNYNFTFKGKHTPKYLQKDESGEKVSYVETLIVEGGLTLGGGTIKTSAGSFTSLRGMELALLNPSIRYRFL